jgi:hypothetical protein
MSQTTRTVLAMSPIGSELVRYAPDGEGRIEHLESATCSGWLHHTDIDAIIADPASMDAWTLGEEISRCAMATCTYVGEDLTEVDGQRYCSECAEQVRLDPRRDDER